MGIHKRKKEKERKGWRGIQNTFRKGVSMFDLYIRYVWGIVKREQVDSDGKVHREKIVQVFEPS